MSELYGEAVLALPLDELSMGLCSTSSFCFSSKMPINIDIKRIIIKNISNYSVIQLLLFWKSGYWALIFALIVDILLNVLSKSLRNSVNIWVCFFRTWLVVFRWLMDRELQLISISLVFSKRCNLKSKMIKD